MRHDVVVSSAGRWTSTPHGITSLPPAATASSSSRVTLPFRLVRPVTTASGNDEGGVGVGVATGEDEADVGSDASDVGVSAGDSAGDGLTLVQPASVAAAIARMAPRNVARVFTRLS